LRSTLREVRFGITPGPAGNCVPGYVGSFDCACLGEKARNSNLK